MSDIKQDQHPLPYQDDEITLKELIEKLLEFWRELWNKKWWIIIMALPFLAYFGYKAKKTETIYSAQLTYLLNDGGGGAGGLAGILGSFGLAKGGKVNLDRLIELSKSRNIIEKVLFTEIAIDTFGPEKDFIANHIIKLYELDKLWTNKKKNWEGFRFKNKSVRDFSSDELAALKMIHGNVVGSKSVKNPIFGHSFNEDTGILTMTSNTIDEQLSIEFVNLVYSELKTYYVKNVVSSSQMTTGLIQKKRDSLQRAVNSSQYRLSQWNDVHRNVIDPNKLAERQIIENQLRMNQLALGEAFKNAEMAEVTMSAGTPEINIIDEPLPPLEPIGPSLLVELLKGGLLGGLLAVGFFIARKIVVDAMAS